MAALLLLLLLTTTASALTWRTVGKVRSATGCVFPGPDLAAAPAPTGSACAARCVKAKACTHFSWLARRCALKAGPPPADSRATPKVGGVCGVAGVGGPGAGKKETIQWRTAKHVQSAPDCSFPGRDYKSVLTPSSLECSVTCKAVRVCSHFTWLARDKRCFIKAGPRPPLTRAVRKVGSVCGVVIPPPPPRPAPAKSPASTKPRSVAAAKTDRNCRYPDRAIATPAVKTWQLCAGRCVALKPCTHFSWTTKGKSCRLQGGSRPATAKIAPALGGVCGYL